MADIVYVPTFEARATNYSSKPPKIGWQELALLYGKRISISGTAVDDDESLVIYTVPTGKVFFLCTADLSMANNDTVRRTSYMIIAGASGAFSTFGRNYVLAVSANQQTSNSGQISPCVPLVMQPGERVGIFNEDTDSTTSGTITGYEIDATLYSGLF